MVSTIKRLNLILAKNIFAAKEQAQQAVIKGLLLMDFPIDRVRLTHSEKNLLTRMKANTGIDNWNIFSRWALCVSLLNLQRLISYQLIPTMQLRCLGWFLLKGL